MSKNYRAVDAKGKQYTVGVNIEKPLGSGGVGTVYSINRRIEGRRRVAKLFHERDAWRSDKIEAMLRSPPAMIEATVRGQRFAQYAWPTHALRADDGQYWGYLMPEISPEHAVELSQCLRAQMRDQYGMQSLHSLPLKLHLLRNLSALLAELHKQGHYFVDLKPHNIKVYRKMGVVALLDCDGYSIRRPDGGRIPARFATSEYMAPEVLIDFQHSHGEYQDRFAFAVIAFQLLNEAIHPFQCILESDYQGPDASNTDTKVESGLYAYALQGGRRDIRPVPFSTHDLWPESLRRLFDRAFLSKPNERPSARQWQELFHGFVHADKSALTHCSREPKDQSHVHFGNGCMACARAERAARKPRKPRPTGSRAPSPPPKPQGPKKPSPSPRPQPGPKPKPSPNPQPPPVLRRGVFRRIGDALRVFFDFVGDAATDGGWDAFCGMLVMAFIALYIPDLIAPWMGSVEYVEEAKLVWYVLAGVTVLSGLVVGGLICFSAAMIALMGAGLLEDAQEVELRFSVAFTLLFVLLFVGIVTVRVLARR